MGLLFGIPLAVVAARWRDLWPDHVSRVFAIGAVSIPIFWIAIILQVVFGQVLHWFPVSGRYDPRQSYPQTYTGLLLVDTLLAGNIQGFFTSLRYMFLPAVCQTLVVIALITRQLRGDLLDLLRKDFVMVARANGIRERIIWTRYLMKNAMIATVAMLGFVIGFELGGNVLIEAVFDWPGIGQYATKAALLLDFQVIMGVTLFIGVVIVFVAQFLRHPARLTNHRAFRKSRLVVICDSVEIVERRKRDQVVACTRSNHRFQRVGESRQGSRALTKQRAHVGHREHAEVFLRKWRRKAQRACVGLAVRASDQLEW
jgi:ABC-type antimicrobial peptide transport system permease subunit